DRSYPQDEKTFPSLTDLPSIFVSRKCELKTRAIIRLRACERKTHFAIRQDLFLALLRGKRFEQGRVQTRVIFFHFFITERTFIGTILQTQGHRTFRSWNVATFESSDQLHATTITNLLLVNSREYRVERYGAIDEQ